MDAAELHQLVEDGFNNGDVDALVALYEPGAQLVRDDGGAAAGPDEIRTFWEGSIALGGRITLKTRYAVEAGDVALLSNEWTFQGDGYSFSAASAEVARRQADGRWLYVIDNPQGGGAPAAG